LLIFNNSNTTNPARKEGRRRLSLNLMDRKTIKQIRNDKILVVEAVIKIIIMYIDIITIL
jgi:hypothetical protein